MTSLLSRFLVQDYAHGLIHEADRWSQCRMRISTSDRLEEALVEGSDVHDIEVVDDVTAL